MWCVDDILWPNADKSATATVTLLKQWRLASIQIDLGREASVLLFLSWAHWNDLITPSFSAYVMSGGKQQGEGGDKAETKQSQKVEYTEELWKDEKLSPIIDIDMKRRNCERGMRQHTRNLQDTLACSGVHISQSIRGPITKASIEQQIPLKYPCLKKLQWLTLTASFFHRCLKCELTKHRHGREQTSVFSCLFKL